jgi:hypothetical protein
MSLTHFISLCKIRGIADSVTASCHGAQSSPFKKTYHTYKHTRGGSLQICIDTSVHLLGVQTRTLRLEANEQDRHIPAHRRMILHEPQWDIEYRNINKIHSTLYRQIYMWRHITDFCPFLCSKIGLWDQKPVRLFVSVWSLLSKNFMSLEGTRMPQFVIS